MANLKVYLVSAIPLLIFFLVFFIVLTFYDKKKVDALNRLSRVFRGRVKRSFVPSLCDADYLGLKFSIGLYPQSKSSPAYLKITLLKNTFFKLSVYKESFLSAIGEKIGILNEVKVDDEVFDKEFLMFSDKPQQLYGYFNNEDVKNAIRELFGFGFNELLIDGNSVFTKKPGYVLQKDLDPQYIRGILRNLNLIAKWANT